MLKGAGNENTCHGFESNLGQNDEFLSRESYLQMKCKIYKFSDKSAFKVTVSEVESKNVAVSCFLWFVNFLMQ